MSSLVLGFGTGAQDAFAIAEIVRFKGIKRQQHERQLILTIQGWRKQFGRVTIPSPDQWFPSNAVTDHAISATGEQ